MDWNTVIALIAALAAIGAAYYARGEVKEAKRAAYAAEEQTKIARQLRIDAAQPYVWVDIRPDDAQGTRLDLIIGNSGPTVAKKVRVKVNPPLPASAQFQSGVKTGQAILTEGIESLLRAERWCGRSDRLST